MMKRLVIAFLAALSLMAGVAGSALATQPDDQACANVGGTPGAVAILELGCGPHGP